MNVSEISLICFPEINPHRNSIKIRHLPEVILDSEKIMCTQTIAEFLDCIKCETDLGKQQFMNILESLLYTQRNIQSLCSGQLQMSFCYALSEGDNIIHVQFLTNIEESPAKDLILLLLGIESLYLSDKLSVELLLHLFHLLRPILKDNRSKSKRCKPGLALNWLRVVEGFILKKLTNKLCHSLLGEMYDCNKIIHRCCLENTIMVDSESSYKNLKKVDHVCSQKLVLLHKNWKKSLYQIYNTISKNYHCLDNLLCIH